jgi:threonine synthase
VLGHRVDDPETIATAIRIGNPASWAPALLAVDESHGAIRAVTDEEILSAWAWLAKTEGVFCEPASAATIAGLIKFGVPANSKVVCVLTGNGLKDPDTAVNSASAPIVLDASLESLLTQLSK